MTTLVAAIIGGIGGAIALLGLVIFFLWLIISQCRKLSNKDSETGSSDPSAVVEMRRSGNGPQEARQFKIEELEQATRHFNESNLIGCGKFGLVFKGFLSDGTIVAVKRRKGPCPHEFCEKVAYLSSIRHRNLVTLLGYCRERDSQMLVFEYLPNGNMCSHLYDTGKDSTMRLEFKQRLSIAIGAAKGLCHLHGLQPPIIHSNFKTANVLVDENFIAKVADAGVSKLIDKIEGASSSASSSFNVFRDPELGQSDETHETNDIYSFGVFLLELISATEATDKDAFQSNDTIVQWVQDRLTKNELVDHRLVESFTAEGMRDLLRLMMKCMKFPGKLRPRMENVVLQLEQILDMEITRTMVMGEGTTTVTLGSHLFTN